MRQFINGKVIHKKSFTACKLSIPCHIYAMYIIVEERNKSDPYWRDRQLTASRYGEHRANGE